MEIILENQPNASSLKKTLYVFVQFTNVSEFLHRSQSDGMPTRSVNIAFRFIDT